MTPDKARPSSESAPSLVNRDRLSTAQVSGEFQRRMHVTRSAQRGTWAQGQRAGLAGALAPDGSLLGGLRRAAGSESRTHEETLLYAVAAGLCQVD